jgi:hypothetical protein
MKAQRSRYGLIAAMWLAFSSLFWGCTFVAEQPYEQCPYYSGKAPGSVIGLTPAQDYAGEVLAYLLQVVVGYAGAPENRTAWRTAGIFNELDLKTISNRLADPEYRKSKLFFLDANLLGLSEVLYHYNPRLNQFKGRYIFDSLYPSPELLAVRLLILQKLRDAETVSFSALLERESLLCLDAAPPRAADLAAINLTIEEFRFLRDIFNSEPLFFHYYKHPFIVDALTRVGFYRREKLSEEAIRRASYKKYARSFAFMPWKRKLNIAILSSLNSEFEFDGTYKDPYDLGFKPTQAYLDMTDALITAILARSADLVRAELQKRGAENTGNDAFWEMLWEQKLRPLIEFQIYNQRPFSIYPEIADRALDDICPESDLSIIVLGKDVYRSIYFDRGDKEPAVDRWLYLDIEDVDYLNANEKIDRIVQFIAGRLLTLTPYVSGLSALPAMPFFPESILPGPE